MENINENWIYRHPHSFMYSCKDGQCIPDVNGKYPTLYACLLNCKSQPSLPQPQPQPITPPTGGGITVSAGASGLSLFISKYKWYIIGAIILIVIIYIFAKKK